MLKRSRIIFVTLLMLLLSMIAYPAIRTLLFQYEHKKTRLPLVPDSAQDYMSRSSVEMNGNKGFIGRGYLDFDHKFLFTNYHVLEKYCPFVPGYACEGSKIDIVQVSQPNLHNPIKIVKAVCWEWMDICALRLEDLGLLREPIASDPPFAAKNPELRTLTLAQGKAELEAFETSGLYIRKGKVFNVLALASRKGMSGTPIFKANDELSGLLTAGTFDFNLFTLWIERTIWQVQSNDYNPFTVEISADVVQKIGTCLRLTEEECHALEETLVINQVQDLASYAQDRSVPFSFRLLLLGSLRFGDAALSNIKQGNVLNRVFESAPKIPDMKPYACAASQQDRMSFISIRLIELHSKGNRSNQLSQIYP